MTDEDDFAALYEASVQEQPEKGRRLKPGQRVEGRIVAIADDLVFVDIGMRVEAHLPKSAVTNERGEVVVAIGDRIKATVSDPGGRGAPQLRTSLGGAGGIDANELRLAQQSGTPVEGEFKTAVKAGLEVDLGGIRAFCPASQVDLAYVANLENFVGQKHFFKVLEIRDGGRSVVVSRKALLLEERERQAQSLLERLEVGAEVDGIVQSLQPYGAFIDLGGVQGLVHVSEITHGRVGNPSDILSVGESVRVKVLSIDSAASGPPRVSLSMKALAQAPASAAPSEEKLEVLTATVNKIEAFGILVDTPQGSGLVPNAEILIPRGSDARRAYKPGDTMEVVMQRRDPSGRLRFSAKAVERVEEQQAFRSFSSSERKRKGGKDSLGSLGDLLKGIQVPDKKA